MSYLGGSIAFLWGQVILWLGRANNAWGASRVWGSGSSFETDSATWQGRANTAYDSGVWGTGNLWSTDAHGDPNVWTDRYNTGFADGDAAGLAAKTTTSQTTSAWTGHSGTSWGYVSMGVTLTSPRAGQAQINVTGWLDGGGGNPVATLRIKVNGAVIVTGRQSATGVGGGCPVTAEWQGALASGDVITVEGTGGAAAGNSANVGTGTLDLTVGSV